VRLSHDSIQSEGWPEEILPERPQCSGLKHMNELPRDELKNVLACLVFLKEKKDRTMKGRAYVHGAPQRVTILTEDDARKWLPLRAYSLRSLSQLQKREVRDPTLFQVDL